MFLYILSSIALLTVSVTMLARANDLRWRNGLVWNVRLIGFIFAGVAPFGMISVEWITHDFPNIYETIFRIGLAFVFVTTPYLPPWWKWITGLDHRDPTWTDDRRQQPKE